jgi:hypothetical protein
MDNFGREIARQLRNIELLAFLEQRFKEAREQPGISLTKAAKRLKLTPHAKNPRRKAGPHSR